MFVKNTNMSTFKYVLRTDYKTVSGYSKIYIRYTHKSKWFDIPTGQSCLEDDWDKELGLPKRRHRYREELLSELESIKRGVVKLKDSLIKDEKEVSVDNLKQLVKNKKKEVNSRLSFKEGWIKHLEDRRYELKPSTVTVYNVTLNHLNKYCQENNKVLSWSLFDLDFEYEWNNYFFDNDISNGTSGKYFKTIKTFLYWGYDRKYFTNEEFRKYKVEHSEPEIYPLKEKEVEQIKKHIVFSNKDCFDRHRNVGRMFLFMCYTSMRFSDLQRLTFSMINKGDKGYSNGYIRMDTQKTGKFITVPLTTNSISILMEIHIGFNMYIGGGLLLNSDFIYDSSFDGSMVNQTPSKRVFPKISNQKFNEYIKELCQLAGINRQVEIIRNVGNQRRSEYKSLWETIGAHTGRRTFITLSLQKGMRPETIMEITGHLKTDTMYRYNKITPDVTVSETVRSWDPDIEEKKTQERFDDIKKYMSDEISKLTPKVEKPTPKKGNNGGGKKNPFTPPDWIE